ncbi:MAG: carbohydrate-binding protein [Acetivibrionales bacterium]|jgi:hypothetical protein
MRKKSFKENGVVFSYPAARVGEIAEILYTGLLKNSGATQVKAHIGYNENWDEAETLEMELKDDAFSVGFPLKMAGSLNCAFVDPLGNWDNNSGLNYSLKVAKATTKTAEKKTAKNTTTKKTTTKKTTAKKTTVAKKAGSTKK